MLGREEEIYSPGCMMHELTRKQGLEKKRAPQLRRLDQVGIDQSAPQLKLQGPLPGSVW